MSMSASHVKSRRGEVAIELTAINVSLRALLLETLPEDMLAPVVTITT